MWVWVEKPQNIPYTFIFSNSSGQYQWVLTQALSLHLGFSKRELKPQTADLFQQKQQSNHGCTACSCTHRAPGLWWEFQITCAEEALWIYIRGFWIWKGITLPFPGFGSITLFPKWRQMFIHKNLAWFFFLRHFFLPSNINFWQQINNPVSFKNLKFQGTNTFCKQRNIARAPQVVVWSTE